MKQRLYRLPLYHHELYSAPLCIRTARRNVHTKRTISSTPSATVDSPPLASAIAPQSRPKQPQDAPLSILPLSSVLRTYMITRLSSSPLILGVTISTLQRMLSSNSPFFHPDKNPLLRFILKHTFYAQFCAGENPTEVSRTMQRIKDTGYSGVILEYALEVLESRDTPSAAQTSSEIATWRRGVLDSVAVTGRGDYVGLKWSGLGVEALRLLKANADPTPQMREAIIEVCDAAAARGVRLLPGAEMESMNGGIDRWTVDLMRRYNTGGRVVMFNTYQAYLRSMLAKLAGHIVLAREEGWTLGAKVVRGAYLGSEERGAIWGTKEETNDCYDGIVAGLLRRKWNDVLKAPKDVQEKSFPDISLVIATHNLPSVRKAMALRSHQAQGGEERIDCAYAQLYGMADDVSAEVVQASKAAAVEDVKGENVDRPVTLKCATWGRLGECLNFLLRRAAENRDAAGRTEDTRRAMGKEIGRRIRMAFGLS